MKKQKFPLLLGPRNRNDMRENNRNYKRYREQKRETLKKETEKNVTLRGNEITVTETENRKYSRRMRSLQAAW